jgi:hypothetical protein
MRRTFPILFLLVALVACGSGQKRETLDATRAGLATAAEATIVAHGAFRAWSRSREAAIVAGAKSYDEGRAALDVFRVEADKVQVLFDVVVAAIKAANDAAKLAQTGDGDIARALALTKDALTSVIALKQAVASLEGSHP